MFIYFIQEAHYLLTLSQTTQKFCLLYFFAVFFCHIKDMYSFVQCILALQKVTKPMACHFSTSSWQRRSFSEGGLSFTYWNPEFEPVPPNNLSFRQTEVNFTRWPWAKENDLVAVLLSDDSCYYFDWSWSALLKSHILRSCITRKLWNQVWCVARIFISLKVYSEQGSIIAKNNHNYAGCFKAKWLSLCLSDHSNDEEEVIILVK